MSGNPTTPDVHRLRTQLPQVTIDGQSYYVAEGDLLIPEEGLATYAAERVAGVPPPAVDVQAGPRTSKLIGVAKDGKLVRWAPGVVLSYYVAKETFDDSQYAAVRSSMADATEDWMETCGVKFQHLPELDQSPALRAQTKFLFQVRSFDAGGRFIALAFYPGDPATRRRMLVDGSFFKADLRFDQVGVLRHELGHVLGFRHEQIRSGAPPDCLAESLADTIELTTQYDPQSVMHYFCGGVGDAHLAITDLDRDGARKLYGPPLAEFHLVEP